MGLREMGHKPKGVTHLQRPPCLTALELSHCPDCAILCYSSSCSSWDSSFWEQSFASFPQGRLSIEHRSLRPHVLCSPLHLLSCLAGFPQELMEKQHGVEEQLVAARLLHFGCHVLAAHPRTAHRVRFTRCLTSTWKPACP